MSIDKQHILHDLYLKESFFSSTSNQSTPLMFSRDSSMETLSSFDVNFHSNNSTHTSEHSTTASGILSPSDIPDSPPRGCDDDIDSMEQRLSVQPLNNTHSTGRTLIPCPEISNPRRPSPTSQATSSSNASSVRSVDIDIEMSKKSDKNFSIRSTNNHITDGFQQEKVAYWQLTDWLIDCSFSDRSIPNVRAYVNPSIKRKLRNYVVFKRIHVDKKKKNVRSRVLDSVNNQSLFL